MICFNSLKGFQIRFPIILILFFSLIGSNVLVIPNTFAQEDTQIPDWIKNTAGWWANNEISEIEFLTGIEYLINNNIISISFMPCTVNQYSSSTNLIPDWVKNNAGWWAADQIEDSDFINGIEYLIKIQIISIDAKKILRNIELEDVTFSSAWKISKNNLVSVTSSFFEVYGVDGDCMETDNGNLIWYKLFLGLNPN